MKCCQFQIYVCWSNTGLVVLNFGFTMFGFGAKFESHFQWHGRYLVPRYCC